MEQLRVKIHNIKNIKDSDFEVPFENGIYTFVGANGCGKSTIMLCLAQIIKNQLKTLDTHDTKGDSFIEFNVSGNKTRWALCSNQKWRKEGIDFHLNGLYEGSLFYGTRFADSTNIEDLLKTGKITDKEIVDADDYVKERVSYILHGDLDHYKTLKRIKNRDIAKKLGIKNLPYFIYIDNNYISQYRMSSGECLLISLLHFLYNSIVRRSLSPAKNVLVLIDELELALHPIAILRLLDLLKELTKEHSNLIIYLSTHSPEIIKATSPSNLFKVNNMDGQLGLENNCYPSYLIRDLYSNISPDFLFLVEDELANLFINRVLAKYNLRNSKLIHCVPVGGWNNVLELHRELYNKRILGTNTYIISILDGDVMDLLTKEQRKLPVLFLPIQSIEKFLYSVIKENTNVALRRIINDKYFIVKSLDEIVSEYNKQTLAGAKDTNKNFYDKLCKELEMIGTDVNVFVSGLIDDIEKAVDIDSFVVSLQNKLQSN